MSVHTEEVAYKKVVLDDGQEKAIATYRDGLVRITIPRPVAVSYRDLQSFVDTIHDDLIPEDEQGSRL